MAPKVDRRLTAAEEQRFSDVLSQFLMYTPTKELDDTIAKAEAAAAQQEVSTIVLSERTYSVNELDEETKRKYGL